MSYAFYENSIFTLPIDAYEEEEQCKALKRDHPTEEDETTTVGDPSAHNSLDLGRREDYEQEYDEGVDITNHTIVVGQQTLPKISINSFVGPYKQPLLVSTSINVFYQCYNQSVDQLDPSCLSILIQRSICGQGK